MSLSPGDKLGPYEIIALIGAGGMGEVYKARDPRLDRIVAVKVSKTAFSQRFEREARAIAQLNHPHICQIYDVGPDYLVMEFVEGQTLKGPLSLDQALAFAGQITSALDAAHTKKITHRDLKPANILVTKSGVKLLDFGLAKIEKPVSMSGDASQGETLTMLTAKGQILGTLLYMSPEQIQGKDADARSDIFSFGLVLYEMLTGKRAFEGSTPASVMGAILERPAPTIESAGLNRVLATCLAKDPDERFQNARDLKRALEWSSAASQPPTASKTAKNWLAWAAAFVFALLAAAAWFRSPSVGQTPVPDLTLTIQSSTIGDVVAVGPPPSISPDGRAVIYQDNASAWQLRRLNATGTERLNLPPGAADFAAWSEDSKSFTVDSDGRILRVRIPDGQPELIVKAGGPVIGASWSSRGDFLYTVVTTEIALYLITPGGNTPQQIKLPGIATAAYQWPQFLPGTSDFLITVDRPGAEDAEVYVATLRDGRAADPVLVMRNRTAPQYTPAGGGQLLFVKNNILYAQKFPASAKRLEGEPVAVASGVFTDPAQRSTQFSVSATGVVVWRPGRESAAQLTTFDRTGKVVGMSGTPGLTFAVQLSPDEKHVMLTNPFEAKVVDPGLSGELSVNRSRGGLSALWSPDSLHLLVPEDGRVLERAVSGGGSKELVTAQGLDRLEDVSPDGKTVLYTHGAFASEVLALDVDGKSPPRPVLQTGEQVYGTRFSPDGRWIVYEAFALDKAGGGLYVQPFPGPGLRRQISSTGKFPVWRKDGREIVFLQGNEVWSIDVTQKGSDLTFAPPKSLFKVRAPGGVRDMTLLAITKDGSRIYLPQVVEQPGSDVIQLRMGWGK